MIRLQSKMVNENFLRPVSASGGKHFLVKINSTICEDIPKEVPEGMFAPVFISLAMKGLSRRFEGRYFTELIDKEATVQVFKD